MTNQKWESGVLEVANEVDCLLPTYENLEKARRRINVG